MVYKFKEFLNEDIESKLTKIALATGAAASVSAVISNLLNARENIQELRLNKIKEKAALEKEKKYDAAKKKAEEIKKLDLKIADTNKKIQAKKSK